MRKPTRAEFESIVLPLAQEYTLEYLSNPTLWGGRYMLDGEMLFYDDESSIHMKNRQKGHLINFWVVQFSLDGNYLVYEIENSKTVDGYKLIDLLYYGTEDKSTYYEKNLMKFWSKFSGKWHSTYNRKGIRVEIVEAFRRLIDDSVLYGGKRAVREWRLR